MQKEIDELVSAGNICDNWNNIRVMQDFTPRNIKNSKFTGKIKLHGFSGKTCLYKGVEFDTGIFNSWINESVIEDACIYDVKLFSNSVACEGALIFNAGSITCDKEMSQIKVGTETGHRILKRQFSEYERTVIGRGAKVCNVNALENLHLGDFACVENGAIVQDSIIENNSVITDNAIVKSSFIGAFSHIGEAEISNSLLGPLMQIHHHSLLISALWAEGRGNVGYGANVGSNHTGRMPDQEIVPGLGQFFGLGCSIKFPANFAEAPFTMIATGVVCEPQRLKFPFSLIKSGEFAGANEIIPGWVYSKNSYGVFRSIYKWDKRGKEKNNLNLFFSKAIMNSVIYACNVLKEFLFNKSTLPLVVNKEELPGLGSNYVKTENVEKIIEAYELYTKDYNFYQKNKKLDPSIISRIEENLKRDEMRGKEIFDDYMEFHPRAEEFFEWIESFT
jgi:carbonic anhydrase/acetyltransferase-like protein (isoleucine patch superfamily)